jgi:hypothetical protein
MAEVEKLSSPDTAESNPSETTLQPDVEKEYMPICNDRNSNTASRTASRTGTSRAASLRSVNRTRSHNGYGCDDMVEDGGDSTADESGQAAKEKDPFEVGWENGESDPQNPRSMALARKWLVVIIVSASSLCV